MSTLAAPISSNTSVLGETPAVEVRDLRKDFIRRDRKAGLFARKRWPSNCGGKCTEETNMSLILTPPP